MSNATQKIVPHTEAQAIIRKLVDLQSECHEAGLHATGHYINAAQRAIGYELGDLMDKAEGRKPCWKTIQERVDREFA